MIGDWVYVPHNGSATHYGRVCGIYEREVVSTTLEKDSGLTKASALNPIPLTREILEKNGWRYNDAPFVQGWEQYGITIINNRITCGQNVSMKVEFVHELQHALRLCGIEKEITL